MSTKSIVVIGSSNTDMVVKSSHLPTPGETVLGGQFTMNPGGKGANQAVAAAALDGEVTFIARVGNDLFGKQAISGFKERGIDTSYLITDPDTASGVALIMVDDFGENCISVALGANAAMQKEDLDAAEEVISKASYLLIQLEIPLEVVTHAVAIAAKHNIPVVLNPAPAQTLSNDLLQSINIITPNETEAEILTGVKVHDRTSAARASEVLRSKGVEIVIISMGAQGVYVSSADFNDMVSSPKVEVIDTTAAGDTFNGALVVALAEGQPLEEATRFAVKAAALSVTKLGAQASTPSRSDLNQLNS